MYAAVHSRRTVESSLLAALAAHFSPHVELTQPDTVVFSITGLRRLIGGPDEIASAISRRGAEAGIEANLAIAASPDVAILAVRNLAGVTVIPRGREIEFLERIRIDAVEADPALLDALSRWGVATLGQLAELPPLGLIERLGEGADRLRRLALGMIDRPLRLAREAENYSLAAQLEHAVESIEQILFVVSPMVNDLCAHIGKNALATGAILLRYSLDGGEQERTLELPLPTRSPQVLLKQVQLDLEARPLGAPLLGLRVELRPVAPRAFQGGLYIPSSPEPDRLQNVLARVGALVGKDNVGSPDILDTHRPDAYAVRPFTLEEGQAGTVPEMPLRLALRVFRPPLAASVKFASGHPAWIAAQRIQGEVAMAAGPWRTSGGWWEDAWDRDEWDVELRSGELYRIHHDLRVRSWFVGGMYD
jgi:protein ImuB